MTEHGQAARESMDQPAIREGTRAFDAWLAGYQTGVPIAVIDTGLNYHHEVFKGTGRFILGLDVCDHLDASGKCVSDADPFDDDFLDAHGTAVASIAAAPTNDGIGMAGTAFSAQVIVEKVYGTPLRNGTRYYKPNFDTQTAVAVFDAVDPVLVFLT